MNSKRYEKSSGNVFKDLGLPDAEEHLARYPNTVSDLPNSTNSLLRICFGEPEYPKSSFLARLAWKHS